MSVKKVSAPEPIGPYIEKIVLKVNKKELVLSVDDARKLMEQLKDLFGDRCHCHHGWPYYYPQCIPNITTSPWLYTIPWSYTTTTGDQNGYKTLQGTYLNQQQWDTYMKTQK